MRIDVHKWVARRYAADQYWGNRGAGVLPLAESTGRLLLNYRSSQVKEPHTWGVWGGALDHGESFREGARRELAEETGYAGRVNLRRLHDYEDGDFAYRTFLGEVPEEFEPRLDWESDDFAWATPSEIEGMYSSLHFGLREVVDSTMGEIYKRVEG